MRRVPGLAVILCLAIVVAKSGCAVGDPAVSAVPKTPPATQPPAITSIAPNKVTEGGSSFTLAATGSNFALDSVVLWNGAPRPTTFSSASQVTATITASDISSAAPVSIAVRNQSSGRLSNTMPLTIEPAALAPTVTGIAPNTVTEGASAFTLSVAGSNFGLDSVILWNGVARQTTFQSPSQVAAAIAASDIATVVPVSIAVRNQNSGRQSNSMTLTIEAATTVSPLRITTTQLSDAQETVAYTTVLTAAGGSPPYQWSLHSGQLPPGLALAAATGEIAGTPTANGAFSFEVELNDSDTSSSTPSARAALSLVVAPAPGNPSPTPGFPTDGTCGPAGCYGPAMGADSLGNTVVGPHGNRVSYRFRARHTGELQSIRVYFIADAVGYSAGTSGKIDVSVHADSGTAAHIPTTKLANYLIANPLDLPRPGRTFRHITFNPSPRLVAGDLYHIVFTNVDASPSANYLSVDALFQRNPQSPTQPAISDVDSALLLDNNNQQWKPRPGYTPIIQFEFVDGWTEGIGYMEAWVGAPQAIGGANSVRQQFTVSGASRKVGSVAVRVARTSGTGSLKVRLETSAGALIEEGAIPSSALAVTSPLSYRWVQYSFQSAHTLAAGQGYHLVLSAPAGTVYQAFPIRKGLHYGFNDTTYYKDGHAQFKSGSNWVGWTQWGVTNRTDGDLQFHFGLVP